MKEKIPPPQSDDTGKVIDLEARRARRLRKTANLDEKTDDTDEKDDGSREWFYQNHLRLAIIPEAFPHLSKNLGLQYRIQRTVDEIRGFLGKNGTKILGQIILDLRHDDSDGFVGEVQEFIRELVNDEDWNFPLIASKNKKIGFANRKRRNILSSDEAEGLAIRAANEKVHQARTGKADFPIRQGEGENRIRECDLRRFFRRKDLIALEGETVRTALQKILEFSKILD